MLSAVKLFLPSLVKGGYMISLLVSWINKFDLIFQSNVLEFTDRSPSHGQYFFCQGALFRGKGGRPTGIRITG